MHKEMEEVSSNEFRTRRVMKNADVKRERFLNSGGNHKKGAVN